MAVELCFLLWQPSDVSPAGLAGAALFGDGAGAIVLSTNGDGPEIIGSDCRTWPDTEHLMGWQHDSRGLFLILDKEVPEIVRREYLPSLRNSAEHVGVNVEGLQHFLLHPGGSRVLDALEDGLEMERGDLTYSREVLRDVGNVSSATVLLILERFLTKGEYRPGDLGVISAMGPGFRVEHVFFRC